MKFQEEFQYHFSIFIPIQLQSNKDGELKLCRSCMMKMAGMNGVEKEKLEKIGEVLSKCEDIINADS